MKFKLREQFENKIEVKDITLLSIEEAKKLPKDILKFSNGYGWWLRSPGVSQDYTADVYSVGLVSYIGNIADDDDTVRPALICKNLEFIKDFEEIEYCGIKWIKISENMLLCNDDTFGEHCFDSSPYWDWENPNYTYEKSDIYKYIHEKWSEIYKDDIKQQQQQHQQQMNDSGYIQITQEYIK